MTAGGEGVGARHSGRWFAVAAALVFLLIVLAWLAGAFDEKIPAGRVELANRRTLGDEPTAVVEETIKATIEEAVGTLRAARRTAVAARVMATVETIQVVAGQQVEAGDVLVTLDARQLQARLDQARQSLAGARAVHHEARLAYERALPLYRKKVLSQSEFDRAQSSFQVAAAQQRLAEEAVREAEVTVSYATVAAPRSGRIVDRLVEPGDVAQPGEPLLVLYDAASLRLEAPVSEHLAVKMQAGDKLEVYVDAIASAIEATVDEIVPQADAPSRSFLVKVSLPRSDSLYEGMFGRLRIPARERRHLCVDAAAVRRVGQLELVDVVRDDQTLERRYVKTGKAGTDGRVEVLSGLVAGERVVLPAAGEDAGGA